MKFTDSPVIDLPVGDAAISLQQDNGSMHVDTSVWPSSLVLVKFIERWSPLRPEETQPSTTNPYADLLDFRGKRRIELGTGCGATGMGLYLLGLTDIAPVMPALKLNLKRNKSVLKKSLKTAQLYWANSVQIQAQGGPFDVVVAADEVYIEEHVSPLVETLTAFTVDETDVVLLGHQLRSPEMDVLFWGFVREVFEVEKKSLASGLDFDVWWRRKDRGRRELSVFDKGGEDEQGTQVWGFGARKDDGERKNGLQACFSNCPKEMGPVLVTAQKTLF